MAVTYRNASADPDGLTRRFYDSELRFPMMNYQGSDIDPDAEGYQIARPMIQVLYTHARNCQLCELAEREGELIVVE